MAAEVIAHELGLDLYKIDLSRVVSKYIGETEKNLRRVFDAAENGGASCSSTRPTRCSASAPRCKTATTATPTSRSATCCSAWRLPRAGHPHHQRRSGLDPAFLRRLRTVVTFPYPTRRCGNGCGPGSSPPGGLAAKGPGSSTCSPRAFPAGRRQHPTPGSPRRISRRRARSATAS